MLNYGPVENCILMFSLTFLNFKQFTLKQIFTHKFVNSFYINCFMDTKDKTQNKNKRKASELTNGQCKIADQ